MDYNKANLRWADRIHRENQVNGRIRSSGYDVASTLVRIQEKINNLPPPSEQMTNILEYMRLKEGCDTNIPFRSIDSLSPRSKYYIPQTSSQQFGWSVGIRGNATRVNQKNIVPGMYNWTKCRVDPPIQECSPDTNAHTLGYVTLLGEDTHPRKGLPRSFSVDNGITRHDKNVPPAFTDQGENAERVLGKLPGDYHLLPHEWNFFVTKATDSLEAKSPLASESVSTLSNCEAVSIPTTIVRGIDSELGKSLSVQKQFINGSGSNKWYRPLNSNAVSQYGDAYTRVMHCGPFSKSQLLVSR